MDQEQQRDHKEEEFNRALLREEDESEQNDGDGNAHNNNSITLGAITYQEFLYLAKNVVGHAMYGEGMQLRDDLQALIDRVNAYQQQLDDAERLQPHKHSGAMPLAPKEQVKLTSFADEREWNPGFPPQDS